MIYFNKGNNLIVLEEPFQKETCKSNLDNN